MSSRSRESGLRAKYFTYLNVDQAEGQQAGQGKGVVCSGRVEGGVGELVVHHFAVVWGGWGKKRGTISLVRSHLSL